MKTRLSVLLLYVCAGLLFPAVAGADPTNPIIHGKTMGEWSGDWWNWVVSYPYAESPPVLAGEVDCGTGQPEGRVWFLAGHFTWEVEPPVERFCAIPGNRALFLPLVNAVVWTPDDCADVEDCRAVVLGWLPANPDLFCYVDGVPCVFTHPVVRTQSAPFALVSHADWGLNQDPAIADGYWVMLPPLARGEHEIRFGANDADGTALQDVTYHLNVY